MDAKHSVATLFASSKRAHILYKHTFMLLLRFRHFELYHFVLLLGAAAAVLCSVLSFVHFFGMYRVVCFGFVNSPSLV